MIPLITTPEAILTSLASSYQAEQEPYISAQMDFQKIALNN
jgi:hypothetical protein